MVFRLFLLMFGLVALPAQAQSTLTGRAIDLDHGGPLAGVRITVCPSPATTCSPQTVTWTDEQGRYTVRGIPTGTWQVQAVYIEQDVGYSLQSPPFTLSQASQVVHFQVPTSLRERLRHTLTPTDPNPKSLSIITGHLPEGIITDGEGLPLTGSHVGFVTYDTGLLRGTITRDNHPVANASIRVPGVRLQTATNANGRYELTGIPPGLHRVHIIHNTDTLSVPPVSIEKGLNLMHFSFRKEH